MCLDLPKPPPICPDPDLSAPEVQILNGIRHYRLKDFRFGASFELDIAIVLANHSLYTYRGQRLCRGYGKMDLDFSLVVSVYIAQ